MNPLNTQPLLRLATFLVFASMTFSYAHAGMIATGSVNVKYQAEANKQLIRSALLRDDVKQVLLNHGVDPKHIQQRINQLTDQEIQQLATQFDQLPAASGVGLVLFATGPIVFMLELMGFTDLTTTF